MENQKRFELSEDLLDQVNGGAIGFNAESNGTYTMVCQYSGNSYKGITLAQVMQIAQYAATIPDTAEGEKKILDWAESQGII